MKQWIWILLLAIGAAYAMPEESIMASAPTEQRVTDDGSITDGHGSTMVHYDNCTSVSTPNGTFLTSGC